VPAAVAEAGLMAHEDLAGAEGVPVRASRRRAGHPLAVRRLHQLAQHVAAVLRLVADYAAPCISRSWWPELPPLHA